MPVLTGAVLTRPVCLTLLVLTECIRLGGPLFVDCVPSVGTNDLSITAAPLELDMLAIVIRWLCGTLILSGPIARSRSAAT